MLDNMVLIGFPNLDPEWIPIRVVKNWEVREPRQIGDTVFFWVGSTYCQMPEDHFCRVFSEKSDESKLK
jgi:hypothetical protein